MAEFEEFVQARARPLLRTAVLLTGDRGHAEDLLQTALERLARRWGRVDDPDLYVRRCLSNLATDRWRWRARRVQEVPDHGYDRPATNDPHLAVEQRLDLIVALQALPPRQRAVLVLRYFDDLSESQVAAVLDISVGTVKSTSSKALAKLRRDVVDATPTTRTPR